MTVWSSRLPVIELVNSDASLPPRTIALLSEFIVASPALFRSMWGSDSTSRKILEVVEELASPVEWTATIID